MRTGTGIDDGCNICGPRLGLKFENETCDIAKNLILDSILSVNALLDGTKHL